ncbi:MAG TPA: UbiA family prenyltransferase [Dehalococcoidia bacterium]|nr:UbiA family prenyltransferase [Dehalococcoidia bacterium]
MDLAQLLQRFGRGAERAAVASGRWRVFRGRWAAGGLYFLFPYNRLLYGLNDVFAFASDRLNPRKRSIEGAVIRPRYFRALINAIIVTNLRLLAMLFATSSAPAAALAFLLFTSIAYSAPPLRFKEVPFLDSFTSATQFVTPLVFGLLYGHAGVFAWLEVIAFTLWAMASQAFGAIQDPTPDRTAGLAPVATYLGLRRTAWFSLSLSLLAVALLLAAQQSLVYLCVVAAFLLYPAYVLWFLRAPPEASEHRHWRFFLYLTLIAGMIITRAFILHVRSSPWGRAAASVQRAGQAIACCGRGALQRT